MRLRQILLNLLSNACKFTKQGEVRLRARRVVDGHNWVELAVADTGIGMTAGAAGPAVPGVQPGRRLDRSTLRRNRAGARDHPPAGAHDGWRCDGDERGRQGLGLHPAPARQRRRRGSQRARLRAPGRRGVRAGDRRRRHRTRAARGSSQGGRVFGRHRRRRLAGIEARQAIAPHRHHPRRHDAGPRRLVGAGGIAAGQRAWQRFR